ncbi:hypothetical protein [Mycoplasmopsis gallinacea]|uniref:Uncharacterized protein n=1 Tax=Mycoplasmopsis gallinacea TaxID=29556 RepID=A0A449A352_9BACT|nr:hypothetical protein [Mycoplasmopsis gallinacea]VEU58667.1 Uncharacterised protein [Mycoplasmopsis gallinacea]
MKHKLGFKSLILGAFATSLLALNSFNISSQSNLEYKKGNF